MAYGGYRSSSSLYEHAGISGLYPEQNLPHPASYAPPYPPPYSPDRIHMPQPRMPPLSNPTTEPYQELLRPQNPYHEGINDVIASAFTKAGTSAYVPPEVVAQITASVIQQLQAAGLDNPQGQQQNQPARHSGHQEHSPTSRPESRSSSTAAQNVYPPPTRRPSLNHGHRSPPSQTRYPHHLHTSPRLSPAPPVERRDSLSSHNSDHGRKDFRPKALLKVSTLSEMITLEKVWGKLFEAGKPTPRLGQFLRGIAVHLIEDYPPGNTIVIVPEKMQKFYEDTKVPSDPYPWQDIFDDRTSSISRMYREVEAEHHLVQEKLHEKPDIPGLTPRGFERWATLMIQAHPDREYERLQKALLDMPISNPDDKKERFPKEIPRGLFPDTPDIAVRKKLEESIMMHCHVNLHASVEPNRSSKAQSHGRTVSVDTANASSAAASTEPASRIERERQRYSAPTSAVEDEEEETFPAHPIERERNPYPAQPGGGKTYDEPKAGRHAHTSSFLAGTRPKDSQLPIFRAASVHRPSASYHPHPSKTKSGRTRSSSVGVNGPGSHRHTESDLYTHNRGSSGYADLGFTGSVYQSGSSSDHPGSDVIEGSSRRYHDYDRDLEDGRTYTSVREREGDRERRRERYHNHPLSRRGSWESDEDYYRGLHGNQGGGGPVGGSVGYDYKPYGYR